MLISDVTNRDEVLGAVLHELNRVGVKIRREGPKTLTKPSIWRRMFSFKGKQQHKKIFNQSLHLLELDDGLLPNGSIAQIPKFVLMACKRIQQEIETEGIFRKAGSVKKLKMIQEHLEKGGSFDKSHTAIEVANLLKTFFRELPEPLIPPGPIQDGLLRCITQFTVYEEKVDAVLMLMLLLPPLNVNTLAYFLQFLVIVASHSHWNLMSIDNLIRIVTPSIMPLSANSSHDRVDWHFKVIEFLIKYVKLIGVVPPKFLITQNQSISPSRQR